MSYTVRDIQARCAALGYDPGPIDGMMGRLTRDAIRLALADRGGRKYEDLFHDSGLHRIHWHWTAGAEGIIDLERKHYNDLHDVDGNTWDGQWRAEAQARYSAGRVGASHTLNANTGAIGQSMDCMAGAVERPFSWGSNPMTWAQVHEMLSRSAYYCRTFDIPVSRYSTLSHAEIEPTLGIKQRFKWDITILPDMDKPGDPVEVGDRLREMLRAKL